MINEYDTKSKMYILILYLILFNYFRLNCATENGCAKSLFNKSQQQVSLPNVSFRSKIRFITLMNISVKEKDVLGGDMVIQYLLWMLKPSDFGQMDPGLIIWLTKKMIDFKFIGIYIEYCKYP